MGYLDDKRKRAKQIIIDSLSEYDSAEEAIEDFHQFFLNSEWPDDECSGRPAAVERRRMMEPGYCASCQECDSVVTLCVLHAATEGLLEASQLAVRALLGMVGEERGRVNVLDTLEAAIQKARKTDGKEKEYDLEQQGP
jgi:hypothetical protein